MLCYFRVLCVGVNADALSICGSGKGWWGKGGRGGVGGREMNGMGWDGME